MTRQETWRDLSGPLRRLALAVALFSALACGPLTIDQTDPAQVGLQARDLSAEFRRCSQSGSIESYLRALPAGSDWRSLLTAGWKQLQSEGADASAATAFTTTSDACTAEPGLASTRGVISVVARFPDDSTALRAHEAGSFGFPTPGRDQVEPGLRQGVATQLGPHSWVRERTLDNHTLSVAFWQSHKFCIFVLASALDTVELQRSLVAMDGRAG